MRVRPSALLWGLVLALASFSPAPPPGPAVRPEPPSDSVAADPARRAAEEQALQSAARGDDAEAALDFFRKRTPSESQRQRLRGLIRDLGDDSFEVRQRASAELTASGPVAAALLRAAARSPDPEVIRRARACLPPSPRDSTQLLHLAAVRLVVRRRPPGTVATLLAYLPFAEDESIAEEVRASLVALTAGDGKPDTALLEALACADPERRAEAGVILVRADLAAARPAVRRLLEDEDSSVRLRVGRALVVAKDRDAIPVLVELFAELTGEDRADLENLLERAAGEDAPAVPRDDDDAARRRRRHVWRGWWQAHCDRVDLSRLAEPPRTRGRTILVQADLATSEGQVLEVRGDGRPPRCLAGLSSPIAAEGLSGDRVLIAEYAGRRVGEWSFDGRLLWQKDLHANPVALQRLPDGSTFVACRGRLLLIDRDGNETVTHRRRVRDVVGARRHPDGTTALLTDDGRCRWVDGNGKEVSSFAAPGPHVMGAGLDVLPNRRVLVPRFGQDRVTEYDAAGNVLWEAVVPGAASAERLPDGHTLVGSTRPPLVVELDGLGRAVWEYRPERALIQATRR